MKKPVKVKKNETVKIKLNGKTLYHKKVDKNKIIIAPDNAVIEIT